MVLDTFDMVRTVRMLPVTARDRRACDAQD